MNIRARTVPLAVAGATGFAMLFAGLAWASTGQPAADDNTEGAPVSQAQEGTDEPAGGSSSEPEPVAESATESVDAWRAAELALEHTGADGVYEVERDDDGWEVELATLDSGQGHKAHVNAHGEVVTTEPDSIDEDARGLAEAEVDLDEALTIATERLGGAVIEANLEHDDDRLRWEIELDDDRELDIDARDGTVVEEDDD